MFDDATAENNHAGLLGVDGGVVQLLDVLDEIDDETFVLPRVEVDDVTKGTIGKGWAIDGDIILPAPVIDRLFVVDLFSDT